MAAEVERLESELAAMTAERDAWQAKFVRRLQAVDELTARAELAKRTLTMCLHWAEKDAALYEVTLAPKEMKDAINHRVTEIRKALAARFRAEAEKGGEG